jgi:branched-chain amino acid transport system substrate-binding protein
VRLRGLLAVGCLTLAAACTEGPADGAATTTVPSTSTAPPVDTPVDTSVDNTVATTVADDGSLVARFAGQAWAFGTVPDGATPADAAAEPVVIGIINQEDSPIGSFPEIRHAVEAAVGWINAELGGVQGRPIELVTCITNFSVERSQACAQQMVQAGAVAVISGIDITATGSLPVLEQNGIPLVSALPTTLAELRSAATFSFSGGITGAYVAFVADAHAKGATSIAIAYGDFESFSVPATEYGAKVAEQLGMDVTLIPFPITTTDYLPVIQAAVRSGADAITVAAADTACVPMMNTIHDLGYTGRTYVVGACAAGPILAQVADGVQAAFVFNAEGPFGDTIEGDLFVGATERYVTQEAGGAGTVGFRAAMNLWAAMNRIDGDITPATILDVFRTGSTHPSFWGHPYTCDGRQVPGMPALCSPQQTLFRLPDDTGTVVAESDGWIDVPSLVAGLG